MQCFMKKQPLLRDSQAQVPRTPARVVKLFRADRKIQPQSTSLSNPDRIHRQPKAIPVAWNAYNGDQVFRRRRECNRTVGIKTGRIHRADSSNCPGNGMATNLDPVLLFGSTETKKDAQGHPLMRLPPGSLQQNFFSNYEKTAPST